MVTFPTGTGSCPTGRRCPLLSPSLWWCEVPGVGAVPRSPPTPPPPPLRGGPSGRRRGRSLTPVNDSPPGAASGPAGQTPARGIRDRAGAAGAVGAVGGRFARGGGLGTALGGEHVPGSPVWGGITVPFWGLSPPHFGGHQPDSRPGCCSRGGVGGGEPVRCLGRGPGRSRGAR